MNRFQLSIIHIISTALFAGLLLISGLLLFYSVVALSGDPGGTLIDGVAWVLEKQESALASLGTFITAAPALALSLANTSQGKITFRGWVYLCFLIPTFFLATVANFILDPAAVSLGAINTPVLADGTALRVAGFALTYITAIFGLNQLGGRKEKN